MKEIIYRNENCPHQEADCNFVCMLLTSCMQNDDAKLSNFIIELNNQA